jgi:hypothetical protein
VPSHLPDPRMIGHMNATHRTQHLEPYPVGDSRSARDQRPRPREHLLLTNLVWQIEEAT